MRVSPAIRLLLLAFLALPASAPAQRLSAAQERALKAGDTFRDCDACPEMVVVPARRVRDGLAGE